MSIKLPPFLKVFFGGRPFQSSKKQWVKNVNLEEWPPFNDVPYKRASLLKG
jgi:hypothetical protein